MYDKHIKNIKEKPIKLVSAFKDLMTLKLDRKDYINQLSNILPKTIKESIWTISNFNASG